MIYGLSILIGYVQYNQDFNTYYQFWTSVHPSLKGSSKEDLYKSSLFDLQRYILACFLVGSGALLLANKAWGSLLGICLIFLNSLYRANPFILTDEAEQKDAFTLFMKSLAVVGGLLLAMTRGKLRNED
mmetsp:Transcript_27136/g.26183  ORF Transcript_27136/g.26183 Transcript_27136/m.26183 type:complete len:129 (+) Transcript_27136:84-470(+)